MFRKMLVSAVALALLSTPVIAEEMIVNGGFEDGLTGWNLITDGGYADAEWYTVYDEIEVGNQVGYTPWNYQVRQDVEPVKVADIEEFSVSARLAYTSTAVVVVTYVVDYPLAPYSDYQYVYIEPEDLTWGTYDILPALDPTKTIESIKLSGYASKNATGAWFDDVILRTHDVEPMLSTMSAEMCVPTVEYVETIVEVPVPVTEYVEKIVEVEKIVRVEVPVDRIVRVEVPVEKIVKVMVPAETITKTVEKIVEVDVVEFITVEVEVPVIQYVDRIVEVEVPVEVESVEFLTVYASPCDTMDYSGMSKKDARSVKKSCEHISKWEARIAKVTSGQGDNNGHHNKLAKR